MLEMIQVSLKRLTVRIALAAVVLVFISLFLPWITARGQSMSMMAIYMQNTSFYAGVPAVILLSLLWIAIWFMLNHPKLTLIGDLPLLFVGFCFLSVGVKYDADMGIGFFIYLIAVLICVIMAFATKKIKVNRK